jgi:hypothetical protein
MAVGCVMARQCHLNTCPVGVATQDEALRAKFPGTPEHVVNFFTFVAQEVREQLAAMGARHLSDIIGRSDLLFQDPQVELPKTQDVDVSPCSTNTMGKTPRRALHVVGKTTDRKIGPWMIPFSKTCATPFLMARTSMSYGIKNTNRTVGGRIAGEIAYHFGNAGLTQGSITLHFNGTAGQSFGAFCIHGLKLYLRARRTTSAKECTAGKSW